jgi:hypothetical protein
MLTWGGRKISDTTRAIEVANSVRLLKKHEIKNLFPEGNIYNEKLFGLTNSFIICGDGGNNYCFSNQHAYLKTLVMPER